MGLQIIFIIILFHWISFFNAIYQSKEVGGGGSLSFYHEGAGGFAIGCELCNKNKNGID